MSCITHFRTELRIKVDAVEAELKLLELRLTRSEGSSEQLVRAHLEQLTRQLALKRPFRDLAESVLELAHEMTTARGQRSCSVDFEGLTRAYNRAWATMDIAAAAIDEAAHAALEAWLAEEEAAKAKGAAFRGRAEGKHEE